MTLLLKLMLMLSPTQEKNNFKEIRIKARRIESSRFFY